MTAILILSKSVQTIKKQNTEPEQLSGIGIALDPSRFIQTTGDYHTEGICSGPISAAGFLRCGNVDVISGQIEKGN